MYLQMLSISHPMGGTNDRFCAHGSIKKYHGTW